MSATTIGSTVALPAEGRLAAYGAALLRVSLGVLYLVHGATKLFVFTPAGTAMYFEKLGLPGGLAYLTIAVELLGGVALVLGAYARWAALVLLPFMLGALFAGHAGNGFSFANAGGGWEYPAFWSVALVVQALLGTGALAVKRS
jgi:putative oxidoreductase